jgi:hypothetical protein
MQMINSTNPAATTPVNQQPASNTNPMNAGSDLIAKMFQNQGGIGGDLMKMLMNPSSLQNLQGDATSDSSNVESAGDGSSAASESSSASDAATADGAKDAGAVLEKLMEDLTSLINLLKNQNSDPKQTQQAQGKNAAESGQGSCAGASHAGGVGADTGAGAGTSGLGSKQPELMSTRPLPLEQSGTPAMSSSSSSQSASNSANGNTTTTNTNTNTKDGVTTTSSTNDQSNVVRGNNLESANGTPAVMTAGSLNDASLASQAAKQTSLSNIAQEVNNGFKAGGDIKPAQTAQAAKPTPTLDDEPTSKITGNITGNNSGLQAAFGYDSPTLDANAGVNSGANGTTVGAGAEWQINPNTNVGVGVTSGPSGTVGNASLETKLTPSLDLKATGRTDGNYSLGATFGEGNTNATLGLNNSPLNGLSVSGGFESRF